MQLPFSIDEFLATFRAYNEAIGIAPLLLSVLAIALVVLAHSQAPWRHTAIALGLAGLWTWSGIVYHWTFFAGINPAANFFGAVFILQALLLIASRNRITLSPRFADNRMLGWAFIVYSILLYPAAGLLLGHSYPSAPTFGAPCPVTLYFAGMMFWSVPRIKPVAIVIPFFWAVMGSIAAFQLGMTEDLALAAAAILLLGHIVKHRHPGIARPVRVRVG